MQQHTTQDPVGDALQLTVDQSADYESTDCILYWHKSHYWCLSITLTEHFLDNMADIIEGNTEFANSLESSEN